MNKVQVLAGVGEHDGEVISVSPNKPGSGYVRVGQQAVEFNEEGFARITKRRALIKADLATLEAIFHQGLATELPGRLVVHESVNLSDMSKSDKVADYEQQYRKMAGTTGITCVDADGQVIYRKCFYSTNPEAQDILVPHANTVEIKAAIAAQRTAALPKGRKAPTAPGK